MNIYPTLNPTLGIPMAGGAEWQQVLLARELKRRGYRIAMVTMDYGQGAVTQVDGIEVYAAFRPQAGWPILRFAHPRWSGIRRALRAAAADIYYVRGASFILAPVVLQGKHAGSQTLFCGAHDGDFQPDQVLLPLARDRKLFYWALRHADHVVAQHEEQRRLASSLTPAPITTIPNGIPRTTVRPSTGSTVLWIGMFRPYKNPERFVELASKMPDTPFVMVGGAGDGSDESEHIEDRVAERSRALPNLTLTGFLPTESVLEQLGQARVLVSTSPCEGFPNIFLQAWSRGVPVVTYHDPGGLVAREGLGHVVRNADEMREKVAEICRSPRTFDPGRLQQFVRDKMSIESAVDSYEAVFRSLMEHGT